ncbi:MULTISPECIES: hypothetical protein [Sphingomonas]|uniref:hypothetical protein n=1 Tax=Sphingomonas TaxID=13687 RepID=UPI0008338FF1|nr:hypothetical protein [Sphingomonas sp. CCH10-B3]MBU0775210.1 hypothetical protein [Alphaproteobacteria bacterium]MBU0868928.1 hypothetical protein [Alphaproteobacteria bacterium]
MASGKEVVHELLVSRDAFVIIADAIKWLTIERSKFQRLRDVITDVIRAPDLSNRELLAAFNRHRPCDGRVRIYLRLSGALNAEFDTLKARLGEVTGDQCGVRETVIFCALAISLRQISLAKAAF